MVIKRFLELKFWQLSFDSSCLVHNIRVSGNKFDLLYSSPDIFGISQVHGNIASVLHSSKDLDQNRMFDRQNL